MALINLVADDTILLLDELFGDKLLGLMAGQLPRNKLLTPMR